MSSLSLVIVSYQCLCSPVRNPMTIYSMWTNCLYLIYNELYCLSFTIVHACYVRACVIVLIFTYINKQAVGIEASQAKFYWFLGFYMLANRTKYDNYWGELTLQGKLNASHVGRMAIMISVSSVGRGFTIWLPPQPPPSPARAFGAEIDSSIPQPQYRRKSVQCPCLSCPYRIQIAGSGLGLCQSLLDGDTALWHNGKVFFLK